MSRITPVRLAIATGLALVVALALVKLLPASLLYPEYCSSWPSANGVPIHPGQFCISYDPSLGRYETPPNEVPADVASFATVTARPDNFRAAYGLATFGIVLIVTWSLTSIAGRRVLRGRNGEPPVRPVRDIARP